VAKHMSKIWKSGAHITHAAQPSIAKVSAAGSDADKQGAGATGSTSASTHDAVSGVEPYVIVTLSLSARLH
jgi:hypothetical protein